MTTTAPAAQTPSTLPGQAALHAVRFVPSAGPGDEVLVDFADPAPHQAACVRTGAGMASQGPEPAAGEGLTVLTLAAPTPNDPEGTDQLLQWVAASAPQGTTPPVTITLHGAQIIWGGARAAILAAPDRVRPFLLALVDFCYYENELRKLEGELAAGWSLLEGDTALACEVVAPDPERFELIRQRTGQTLGRRIRLARIEPWLYQPRPHLPPLANQLLERLYDKAGVEDRLAALDSRLEVFEEIYDTSSQRISTFREARQTHALEWVVIVLLAAETVLLLISVLWHVGV